MWKAKEQYFIMLFPLCLPEGVGLEYHVCTFSLFRRDPSLGGIVTVIWRVWGTVSVWTLSWSLGEATGQRSSLEICIIELGGQGGVQPVCWSPPWALSAVFQDLIPTRHRPLMEAERTSQV